MSSLLKQPPSPLPFSHDNIDLLQAVLILMTSCYAGVLAPTIRTFSKCAYVGRPEIPLSQHPSDFDKNHKVLTYVEYRAVSGVFQNIDPPTLSPLSECVLHPHHRRYTMAGRWGGGGSIFWKTPGIGLASYSIISPRQERKWVCVMYCTYRTLWGGGGEGRGEVIFFQVFYPQRKAFFLWIRPSPPPPHPFAESKFWEGLHNAMRRKIQFLKPVYRSLPSYQS